MMVNSTSGSNRGQYKKYKKKVWIPTESSEEVEIEVEIYDIDIIEEIFVSYDSKGNLIIKETNKKSKINLLV